jgi:hypothetical protein
MTVARLWVAVGCLATFPVAEVVTVVARPAGLRLFGESVRFAEALAMEIQTIWLRHSGCRFT